MKNNKMECSVFSRVTGYVTDVNRWNDGKTVEFSQRRMYDEAAR